MPAYSKKVGGPPGLLTFAGFLDWHRFGQRLAKVPPRTKERGLPSADLGLAFRADMLAGAQRPAQVACARGDVMLPALLCIQQFGSQSRFTRCFRGFNTAGKNPGTFRSLRRWCLERLPSGPGGYELDLDSTRLLHEDGQAW